MEGMEQQSPDTSEKCIVCGSPDIEQGYRATMCAKCRTMKSRFPIPAWVHLFAAGILLLVLIDILRLPKYFKAKLHYERGIKAENDTDFATAEKEFKYVADVFPSFPENNLRLIVCCERNLDFDGMNDVTGRVRGQESDDVDLVNDANSSIAIMNNYNDDSPADTFLVKIKDFPASIYVDSLRAFNLKHSDNTVRYVLANKYYESSDFSSADSLANLIIRSESYNAYALSLKAAIKREEKQYDSALRCYNYMLGINHQLIIPLNGIARVYIKMGKDAEALIYAEKAYGIDSANSLSLEAMALVNYSQHKQQESNRFLSEMKKLNPPDSDIIYRTEGEMEVNADTNH